VPPRIAVAGRHRPYAGGALPEEPFIVEGLQAAGARADAIDVHGVPSEEALRRVLRFSSDVLIASHACLSHAAPFWEALAASGQHRRVVLWTPDLVHLPGRPEQYAERAAFCDLLLHPANAPVPGIPHAAYLCAAATPAEGTAEAVDWGRHYDLTCAFVGTPYDATRQRLVSDLGREFGAKFKVFSLGVNGVYGPDLARVCSRTRVVVGCNVRDDIPGYWSDRMYQVPAHGGFLLATAPPGVEKHLRPGEHFAPLPDPARAVDEVRRWVRDEPAREAIRVAGFRHVRQNHTWKQRAAEMLDILGRRGLLAGAPAPRAMFRFVVPVYNSEAWVGRCIESIRQQSIRSWRCVVVDDASTDGTWDAVQRAAGGDDRFLLVRNPQRRGALANIMSAIDRHAAAPSDVVVTVDGDDWLAHARVLERLLQVYRNPRAQLTYGQFRQVTSGDIGWCREYPAEVKAARSYRSYDGLASHLRTFRYGLYRRIKREDLLDPRTKMPWAMAWDLALMLPMLEMCLPDQVVFIPDVLYSYNDANPLNDHKVNREEQIRSDRAIRALLPYSAT